MKHDPAIKKAQAQLQKLRRQIDVADRKFMKALAKRFRIVSAVGHLKNKHGFPIKQKSRMTEMLNGRRDDAAEFKLDGRLIYNIFDLIHEASITCQEEIVKKSRQLKSKKINKNKKVGSK